MISHQIRENLRKIASYAIGLCGSAKPEKQAEAAIDAILKEYNITPINPPKQS